MRLGPRRLFAIAAALALSALAVPAAQAQLLLSHSEALACLTPPPGKRGVPEYDPELVRRKDGGTIKVELEFRSPNSAPTVRVLGDNYLDSLAESVRRHVQRFRVPCLPRGAEPARLVFEFVFTPEDGRPVYGLPPTDANEAAQREKMKCLTRIDDRRAPEYPAMALHEELQGHYLTRLTFSSPTAPPELTFLFGPRHGPLRASLRQFVSGYRLPCMEGTPVDNAFEFVFKIDGGTRSVVRDMTLLQLLSAATRYTQPVVFDLAAMGCPFDVRMRILQPYLSNAVAQVGERQAAREPLLRWLSEMHFKIAADKLEGVIGKPFTVSVPCGKVDL